MEPKRGLEPKHAENRFVDAPRGEAAVGPRAHEVIEVEFQIVGEKHHIAAVLDQPRHQLRSRALRREAGHDTGIGEDEAVIAQPSAQQVEIKFARNARGAQPGARKSRQSDMPAHDREHALPDDRPVNAAECFLPVR